MQNKIKKRGSYTALSNEIVNDSRLNLRSLGLFLFMWSKPDSWNFTLDNLAKARNVGRDQIKHALQELKKYGYVHYEKQKDGTGIYHMDDRNRERTMKSPKVDNPPKGEEEEPKGGKATGGKSTPSSNTIMSNIDINNHGNKESDFSKYFPEEDPREIEREKWEQLNEMLLEKAIRTDKQREHWREWEQAQLNPVHDGEEE